jgi:hypothetical protein
MICPCCDYDATDAGECRPFIEIAHLHRGPLVAPRGYDGQAIWTGTPDQGVDVPELWRY